MIPVILLGFAYVALSVGRVPGLRSDRLGACIVAAALTVALGVLSLSEARAAIDPSSGCSSG